MKSLRIFLWAFTIALALVVYVQPASAHRDGCHRWHSCPSDSGSYVCGDLGYTSECPATNPAPQTVQPAAPPPAPVSKVTTPVITTKTITTEELIPYGLRTVYTGNEYPDYSKVTQAGINGQKRMYTEITYTNGVETSRKVAKTEVIRPTTEEVTTKGNRLKPTAKLTAFSKTDKKDKYDISGKYKANSVVVLSLDGKRIKRSKTDENGRFVFKAVKVISKTPKIAIFNRVGNKETRISEPVFVDKTKTAIKTEYAQLH